MNQVGYEDVKTEHKCVKCRVVGKLPAWLRGSYYKQTGGAFIPSDADTPLLDGLGHIVAFHFDNQNVQFSNKFVKSKPEKAYRERGDRNWGITAVQPNESGLLEKAVDYIESFFVEKLSEFNLNVNVWRLRGSVPAAASELPVVVPLQSKTLESKELLTTIAKAGMLHFPISTAAHYLENENLSVGNLHIALEMFLTNMISTEGPTFNFKYVVYSSTSLPFRAVAEKVVTSCKRSAIPDLPYDERPSYMHCYAQTKNYFIIPLNRQKMLIDNLLASDFSKGFFGLFPTVDHPLGFQVWRINSSNQLEDIGVFYCNEALSVIHLSNSFETSDGNVVMDFATYTAFWPCGFAPGVSEANSESSSICRFVLNPNDASSKVSVETLCGFPRGNQERDGIQTDCSFEFPNINPCHLQSSYNSMFALSNPFERKSTVVRYCIETKTLVECQVLLENDSLHPGEPVFAPKPGGRHEQEGVVLTTVIDLVRNESFLLVLDPNDLKEIARVYSPIVMNYGLHGAWFGEPFVISKM